MINRLRAKATDDLLAAQARGALVEIVADHDVLTNRVGRRLLREVERRDGKRDNVVVCAGACLPWRAKGPAPAAQDVNHLKLVLSELGGEQWVSVTSSNLAAQHYHKYNSLVRVTQPSVYAFYLDYFQRLHKQSLRFHGETWDDRDKAHNGRDAGSGSSSAATNLPDSLVRTLPIHDKAISIHARMGGREQWLVLTGTSNSTCGGLLYNDEAMMRFGGQWAYHQYAAHFAYAFARAHQSTRPLEVPAQKHCS